MKNARVCLKPFSLDFCIVIIGGINFVENNQS